MFLNNPEDFITNLNGIASKKIQLYIDKLIIYTRIYRRYYALGVNMMQIARLRVAEESEKGETGKGIAQNEIVWDYIVDNYNSWDSSNYSLRIKKKSRKKTLSGLFLKRLKKTQI